MQAVIEREALLSKREQELLVFQEKLASKESVSSLLLSDGIHFHFEYFKHFSLLGLLF